MGLQREGIGVPIAPKIELNESHKPNRAGRSRPDPLQRYQQCSSCWNCSCHCVNVLATELIQFQSFPFLQAPSPFFSSLVPLNPLSYCWLVRDLKMERAAGSPEWDFTIYIISCQFDTRELYWPINLIYLHLTHCSLKQCQKHPNVFDCFTIHWLLDECARWSQHEQIQPGSNQL